MSKEAYNFHQIKFTADEKKINHFEILKKAFNLNMFEVEEKDKNLLSDFINSLKEKNESFKSQLYQDVFADYLIKNEDRKTFLEFGATNGIDLCEPDPQWYEKLKKNRPKTKIILNVFGKRLGTQ